MPEKKRTLMLMAGLCIVIGGVITAIAAGLIDVPAEDVHAPMWVLAMCGGVFLVAGLILLAGPESRLSSFGAFFICASFGCVGAWVAIFAAPESISGGLPFLSRTTNGMIGKWLFGFGALISFAIAGVALRECLRTRD